MPKVLESSKEGKSGAIMTEEVFVPRSEQDIRDSVFGKHLEEIHLGNYDNSITRPTVASARRSVHWSRERKIYETQSRRRLEEFKGHGYFKYEYPEIPRHWPGTWAVMSFQELDPCMGRLSRPSTARPRTAPLHQWLKERKIQSAVPRTVITPKVVVS